MQRQSFGSPLSSPSAAAADPKLRRRSRGPDDTGPARSIHLIPLLTFLCFLVLYLLSHEPSPQDLRGFRGVSIPVREDTTAGGLRGLKELQKLRHRKAMGGR